MSKGECQNLDMTLGYDQKTGHRQRQTASRRLLVRGISPITRGTRSNQCNNFSYIWGLQAVSVEVERAGDDGRQTEEQTARKRTSNWKDA